MTIETQAQEPVEALPVIKQEAAIDDILREALEGPQSKKPSEPEATDTSEPVEADEKDSVEAQEDPQEASSDENLTWAKALGVDDSMIVLDEDGNFKGVQVKVDGKLETVDLKTALEGYRFNAHNTQTSQKLAAEKKEFDTLRSQAAGLYHQKLTEAAKLTEYLDQKLLGEFNIDWQGLRATDPAEYAARVQDYQLRQAEIQQIKAAINNEMGQIDEQAQAAQQQQMQAYLQDQLNQLMVDIPEWQDKGKMQADFDQMATFVSNYGFSPEEFNSVMDSRMIKVVRDAMAYRNGKNIASAKLDKPLPKFMKSTNTAPVSSPSKLDKLVKAARKATGYNQGKLQDAAINELLAESKISR